MTQNVYLCRTCRHPRAKRDGADCVRCAEWRKSLEHSAFGAMCSILNVSIAEKVSWARRPIRT